MPADKHCHNLRNKGGQHRGGGGGYPHGNSMFLGSVGHGNVAPYKGVGSHHNLQKRVTTQLSRYSYNKFAFCSVGVC